MFVWGSVVLRTPAGTMAFESRFPVLVFHALVVSWQCQKPKVPPYSGTHPIQTNVAPLLVEGFGLMKSFREIIQNQLLFEGFGIMKSFWARN